AGFSGRTQYRTSRCSEPACVSRWQRPVPPARRSLNSAVRCLRLKCGNWPNRFVNTSIGGNLMRPIPVLFAIAALGLCGNVSAPDDKKPSRDEGESKVVREWVRGQLRRPDEKILRIAGKVEVRDANTLVFGDG